MGLFDQLAGETATQPAPVPIQSGGNMFDQLSGAPASQSKASAKPQLPIKSPPSNPYLNAYEKMDVPFSALRGAKEQLAAGVTRELQPPTPDEAYLRSLQMNTQGGMSFEQADAMARKARADQATSLWSGMQQQIAPTVGSVAGALSPAGLFPQSPEEVPLYLIGGKLGGAVSKPLVEAINPVVNRAMPTLGKFLVGAPRAPVITEEQAYAREANAARHAAEEQAGAPRPDQRTPEQLAEAAQESEKAAAAREQINAAWDKVREAKIKSESLLGNPQAEDEFRKALAVENEARKYAARLDMEEGFRERPSTPGIPDIVIPEAPPPKPYVPADPTVPPPEPWPLPEGPFKRQQEQGRIKYINGLSPEANNDVTPNLIDRRVNKRNPDDAFIRNPQVPPPEEPPPNPAVRPEPPPPKPPVEPSQPSPKGTTPEGEPPRADSQGQPGTPGTDVENYLNDLNEYKRLKSVHDKMMKAAIRRGEDVGGSMAYEKAADDMWNAEDKLRSYPEEVRRAAMAKPIGQLGKQYLQPQPKPKELPAANAADSMDQVAKSIANDAGQVGGVKGEVFKDAADQAKKMADNIRAKASVPVDIVKSAVKTYGDDAPFIDQFHDIKQKIRILDEEGKQTVAEIAEDLRPNPTIMQKFMSGAKGAPQGLIKANENAPALFSGLQSVQEKIPGLNRLEGLSDWLERNNKLKGMNGEDPMVTIGKLRGRKVTTPFIEAMRKQSLDALPGGRQAWIADLKNTLDNVIKTGKNDPETLDRIMQLERSIENIAGKDVGGAGRIPLINDEHINDLSRLVWPSIDDDAKLALQSWERGMPGFSREAVAKRLYGYEGRFYAENEAERGATAFGRAGGKKANMAGTMARTEPENPFLHEIVGQPDVAYARRALEARNRITRWDQFQEMKDKGAAFDPYAISAAQKMNAGIGLSPMENKVVANYGGKQSLMAQIAKAAEYTGEDPLTQWKQLPKADGLLQISGHYVPSYTVNDIAGRLKTEQGFMDVMDKLSQVASQAGGMQAWKLGKTALATTVRGHVFMGRLVLANAGGMNLMNPENWSYVLRTLKNDPALMSRMQKAGTYVFGRGELPELEFKPELYGQSPADHAGALEKWTGFVNDSTQAFAKLPGVRQAIKSFAWDENVFRRAGFQWAVDHGATDQEAAKWVNKWMVDYEDIPRWLRVARRLPFPFVTFPVMAAKNLPAAVTGGFIGGQGPRIAGRASNPFSFGLPSGLPTTVGEAATFLPRLAKNAAGFGKFSDITGDLPTTIRFAAGAGAAYEAYKLSQRALGLSDQAVQQMNDNKPEYAKRSVLFVLPWRDKYGQIQALDLTRNNPYGAVFDAFNQLKQSYKDPASAASSLIPTNPVSKIVAMALTGVDPFTKRPIYNKLDPPVVKWQRAADIIYKELAPPIAPALNIKRGALGGAAIGGGIGFNLSGPPGAAVGAAAGGLIGAGVGALKPSGGYTYERLSKAAQGLPDTSGRKESMGSAIASSLGQNVVPIPQAIPPRKRDYKAAYREYINYLTKNGYTPKEIDEALKTYKPEAP